MKRRNILLIVLGLTAFIILALVLTRGQGNTDKFLKSLPYYSSDFNIQKVSDKELIVLVFTEDMETGKQEATKYIRSRIGGKITKFKITYDQSRAARGTGTPDEPANSIILPIGPANDNEDY